MVALKKLRMTDVSRQRHLEVELDARGDLTPAHTVGQAIDLFRQRLKFGESDQRWSAFSRGVTMDNKRKLSEVPETDADWTVIPEVSAG